MRTLTAFNENYEYMVIKKVLSGEDKKSSPLKSAIFYFALAAMVLIAFVYSNSDDAKNFGKKIGPLAINNVLTDSMDSVYPAGTLIGSWSLAPGEELSAGLSGGDDIVFITENGKVVVHRIVKIFDDYEDSNQRGFVTQGVENNEPDTEVTFEGNVMGKVVWSVPYVGRILLTISENILFVIAGLGVIVIIGALLKYAFEPVKKK